MRSNISVRGCSMRAIPLLLGALLIVSIVPACEKEHDPTGIAPGDPAGYIVSHTGCKPSAKPAARLDAPPDKDCAEWVYTPTGTLELKHVNAGFNCCPGEITADITISDDSITIVEHESMAGCHCLCLFDIDYRIDNLPPGTYTISFVEPYALDDPPLAFTVALSSTPMGRYCVDRTHYPWRGGGGSTQPAGKLIDITDCADAITPDEGGPPTDLSCVEWRLYEGGILRLKHIHAGFNCCGDIGAGVTVENGVITIEQREGGPPCDCLCLYDLEFEISNIEQGTYRIRFVELYTQPGDDALDFTVNLAECPAGIRCAFRTHYPWGYSTSLPEDQARLAEMGKAIVDFIGTPSCGSEGDCRSIGFGSKPCGGPWSYLIYSAAVLDECELRRRVLGYNAFNYGMNRRHGLASTCDVPAPPLLGCVRGVCVDLRSPPR